MVLSQALGPEHPQVATVLLQSAIMRADAGDASAAGALARAAGAKVLVPAAEQIDGADYVMIEGDVIRFGNQTLVALHTPGHTAGSMCYRWGDNLFSGDTLLIDGCGRTDLPGGDAGALFNSITTRLFALPDETVVYPAHDYRGRTSSTIGAERRANSRLANRARPEFVEFMNKLDLSPPRMIDLALPANRRLGLRRGAVGIHNYGWQGSFREA